ncbi:MAG: sortase [Bacilli bacterium]|nr:sortase [Bacilli bacterium]
MAKQIIKIILILVIYIGSCYIIYKQEKPKEPFQLPRFSIKEGITLKERLEEKGKDMEKEKSIGYLDIPSISLKEKLYSIDSIENNVDKNITILEGSISPSEDNSIFFLAAHSGTGPYAYFKNLNKVRINEEIILKYEDKEYKYTIKEMWETDKDGDIEVQKGKENQLILTTCSPTNKEKQLVINCIKKES